MKFISSRAVFFACCGASKSAGKICCTTANFQPRLDDYASSIVVVSRRYGTAGRSRGAAKTGEDAERMRACGELVSNKKMHV